MVRRFSQLASLALVMVTSAGLPACSAEAVDDSAPASEHDLASKTTPGLDVEATWRRLVTGTPTYGYDATSPFLRIELVVEDALVANAHPGFDGLESPFALVPRAHASERARIVSARAGSREC